MEGTVPKPMTEETPCVWPITGPKGLSFPPGCEPQVQWCHYPLLLSQVSTRTRTFLLALRPSVSLKGAGFRVPQAKAKGVWDVSLVPEQFLYFSGISVGQGPVSDSHKKNI